MKYRRLKTLDSNGHPTLRYYKLSDDIAYANAFYQIEDDEATIIEGELGDGAKLIGFSHGGNNLAKKLIFLDINQNVVYMGIFEEGEDDRPAIGDLVNGYQRVIDTHYDGDDGVDGKNDDGFGVETLDNPYYLFVTEQPAGTDYASEIDDEGAGEESGTAYPVDPGRDPEYTVTFDSDGGSDVPSQEVLSGRKAVEPKEPTKADKTFGGWYSDDLLTTAYDFDTPVRASITLYAKWTD